VSIPTGLESIAGAKELHDWFGYWPDFHDAEVLIFRLDTAAPSLLALHTWEMTNKIDEQGYYELTKHVVVRFELESIRSVSVVDLWHKSILLDLTVDTTESGFQVSFSAAYGISGTIELERLSLSVTPGKPSPPISLS
jgi:hypothetical protein